MKITINAIEADKPTCNNRIYPRAAMEKAVAEYNERIKNGKCFVLKESPEGSNIPLHTIGMKVTSCEMCGDKMVIDAEFLNTPAGKDMKKLLNFGEVIPNVVGSIKPDRTVEIDEVISFSLTGNPIK
jgi:hypothetical protein